jgi:hypothetical protein
MDNKLRRWKEETENMWIQQICNTMKENNLKDCGTGIINTYGVLEREIY